MQEFVENNAQWLEDINVKLENYVNSFPKDDRSDVLKKLQGINVNS
ncbi:MAG: hypothetical protein ACK5LT_07970 [Lachnospirales bacterium]